jgi:hypothetical protein
MHKYNALFTTHVDVGKASTSMATGYTKKYKRFLWISYFLYSYDYIYLMATYCNTPTSIKVGDNSSYAPR